MTLSLLEISDLTVVYPTRTGKFFAVQDVNLSVQPGEILGIVGESGAGKSTISAAIMQLIDYPGYIEKGSIKLSNVNLIFLPTECHHDLGAKAKGLPLPLIPLGDNIKKKVILEHVGIFFTSWLLPSCLSHQSHCFMAS